MCTGLRVQGNDAPITRIYTVGRIDVNSILEYELKGKEGCTLAPALTSTLTGSSYVQFMYRTCNYTTYLHEASHT